ncbi:hypothetical protein N0V83_001994 [Neocucurbitaria cava]|uniref:Uncharacterized protein n=1 Tax=Neocucurbitaria cava TaxID=798079 RepID=A0A9W9CPJ2_9PLEO|nr:hypothetical protein N0V83_001994 [Neocucurbitaria cava]
MPPSFTFWKPSNADDQSRSPLLLNDDDAVVSKNLRSDAAAMPATQRTAVLDLDPGTEDSGVFFFDEADFQPPTKPAVPAASAAAVPLQSLPLPPPSLEEPQASSCPIPAVGGEKLAPATRRDRDSAVYLSEDEIPSSKGQTPSLAPSDPPTTCLRTPPFPPLKCTPSTHSSSSPLQRTDSHARRLRRPADLHLLTSKPATVDDTSKQPPPAPPRSELEQRYDLIRNSKSHSTKATNLRSPTELLRERLNLSPKKHKHEEKVRIFTPPSMGKKKSSANGGGGCLMPSPGGQSPEAFRSTSIRARTEAGGRPAWWCKFDKLVVFDGIDVDTNGKGDEPTFRTRTSKGLSIARRRGSQETIVIPMDCAHCQVMLNRVEWKYDVRVCKRGVCWECRARCRWEVEQERHQKKQEQEEEESTSGLDAVAAITRSQASRDRADSVLQDEQVHGGDEELLARKVGIEEQGRKGKGTIEVVGGIDERLESLRMGN